MKKRTVALSIPQLAAQRRACRVAQAELARLIGRSTSWISHCENGLVEPTEEERQRYEKALRRLQLERVSP